MKFVAYVIGVAKLHNLVLKLNYKKISTHMEAVVPDKFITVFAMLYFHGV